MQKPLTPTVGEARELLRLSRLNGVCKYRGYRDYGCGALGDMACCHLTDAAYGGLQLGAAASVEPTNSLAANQFLYPTTAAGWRPQGIA